MRVGVRHDRSCAQGGTVLQLDAGAGLDGSHRRSGDQSRARRACGCGDGRRHVAHATDDVAPASERPELVQGPDPSRSRIPRTGEGPDDPAAVQGGPQPLVADVTLHEVGDRHALDHRPGLAVFAEQVEHLVQTGCLTHPRVALTLAQRPAQTREHIPVGAPAVDVARRQPRHLGSGAVLVVVVGQTAAVGEWAPGRGLGRDGAVAVAGEVELGDDQGMQQADQIGARADHEALVAERALEGAGAAEALAALEHEDRPARACEIGSGGQAVVAGPHDDGVPGSARRGAEADRVAGQTGLDRLGGCSHGGSCRHGAVRADCKSGRSLRLRGCVGWTFGLLRRRIRRICPAHESVLRFGAHPFACGVLGSATRTAPWTLRPPPGGLVGGHPSQPRRKVGL